MRSKVRIRQRDATFLDAYAHRWGIPSRSAVLRLAIQKLRHEDLVDSYAMAWAEWDRSPDAALWETTVGDGLDHD